MRHIKPTPLLSPYVTHFWLWEQNHIAALPDMLPGTGVELLLNFGDEIIIKTTQSTRLRFGEGVIICPRKSLMRIQATGATKVLSIRFRSSGFFTLFGLPLTELSDQACLTENLLPTSLQTQLIDLESSIEKIGALEQWLLQQVANMTAQNSALPWAIDKIYYQHHDNCIAEIKSQLKCSERTFQRKFKLFTGVDAKYFERTSRFQSTLKILLAEQSKRYITTALDHGYYDQAHFIKEFKHFTQTTPSEYLVENNFLFNYYSLNS